MSTHKRETMKITAIWTDTLSKCIRGANVISFSLRAGEHTRFAVLSCVCILTSAARRLRETESLSFVCSPHERGVAGCSNNRRHLWKMSGPFSSKRPVFVPQNCNCGKHFEIMDRLQKSRSCQVFSFRLDEYLRA